MAPQEGTLRVGASSEDMERGTEFLYVEWGFPATLKDPTVYVKSGRPWGGGVDFVGIGPGKALYMLWKGINTKYGITLVVAFLCGILHTDRKHCLLRFSHSSC